MAELSAAPSTAISTRRDHIIDVLIRERAPRLSASPAWPVIRPLLYAMLSYGKARQMARAIEALPGRAALDYISNLLALRVETRGLERVAPTGPLLIVCNHPTGIADGIAVYDALKAARADLMFYANADAHRVSPGLSEVLIPVEWVAAKRTREHTRLTLQMTRDALQAGRALVVFPAGRLARMGADGRLHDPVWMSTAVSLAQKYQAPVLPLHLSGPASTLFHLFNRVSPELRDITLFHEFLNKRGRAFELLIGPEIAPCTLDPDAVVATAALKRYIERDLPLDPDLPFAPDAIPA
jgi:putative hemolysin